jgi:hypothetical protein
MIFLLHSYVFSENLFYFMDLPKQKLYMFRRIPRQDCCPWQWFQSQICATTILILPVVGKSLLLISNNSYVYVTNRLNDILVQFIPTYSMHSAIF